MNLVQFADLLRQKQFDEEADKIIALCSTRTKVYRGLALSDKEFDSLTKSLKYEHVPGWRHFEIGYPAERVFVSTDKDQAIFYAQSNEEQENEILLTFEVDTSKLAIDIASYNLMPERFTDEQGEQLFGPTWKVVKTKMLEHLQKYKSIEEPFELFIKNKKQEEELPTWSSKESFYDWLEHYTPWIDYWQSLSVEDRYRIAGNCNLEKLQSLDFYVDDPNDLRLIDVERV